MKRVVFALLVMSLAGCSALGLGSGSSSSSGKSDGSKTANPELITINCSGFADWGKCNEKASAMCPKGYDVATRDESMITQRRTMRFSCN